MRNKVIFILAIIGLVAGLTSAFLFGIEKKPHPPAFNPAFNPYGQGIYANGIIESYQSKDRDLSSGRYVAFSFIIARIVSRGLLGGLVPTPRKHMDSISDFPRADFDQPRSTRHRHRQSTNSAQCTLSV